MRSRRDYAEPGDEPVLTSFWLTERRIPANLPRILMRAGHPFPADRFRNERTGEHGDQVDVS